MKLDEMRRRFERGPDIASPGASSPVLFVREPSLRLPTETTTFAARFTTAAEREEEYRRRADEYDALEASMDPSLWKLMSHAGPLLVDVKSVLKEINGSIVFPTEFFHPTSPSWNQLKNRLAQIITLWSRDIERAYGVDPMKGRALNISLRATRADFQFNVTDAMWVEEQKSRHRSAVISGREVIQVGAYGSAFGHRD